MNILKKLNEIDIKDLKKINLNDIKPYIKWNLDIVIVVIIVIITLVGVIGFYNNFKSKEYSLRKEVLSLKEKVLLAEEYKQEKSRFDNLVSGFPQPVNKDRPNKELSKHAVKNNIQILSFAPKATIAKKDYVVKRFRIRVSSEDYKNLIQFVQDIENSPYAMKITAWSAKNLFNGKADPVKERLIEVKLTLESIELKDEL